jgi:hypothetical protein
LSFIFGERKLAIKQIFVLKNRITKATDVIYNAAEKRALDELNKKFEKSTALEMG